MIWLFEFTDIAMFEDSSKVTDKPMAESSLKNESGLITNDSSITSTKIKVEPIKRPMLGKIPKSHSVSTGTSPPPQSISTQVREKRSVYLDYRTLPRIKKIYETRNVRYICFSDLRLPSIERKWRIRESCIRFEGIIVLWGKRWRGKTKDWLREIL